MTNKTITETKIKLTGIDHFALNVHDMDRAIQFYQDVRWLRKTLHEAA